MLAQTSCSEPMDQIPLYGGVPQGGGVVSGDRVLHRPGTRIAIKKRVSVETGDHPVPDLSGPPIQYLPQFFGEGNLGWSALKNGSGRTDQILPRNQ